MPNFSLFDHDYHALVIGSGGAIGSAFLNAFKADPHCKHAQGLSRSEEKGFDLLSLESILLSAQVCQKWAPYHVIIDATGALSIEGVGPEKSLAALEPEQLQKAFQVNTIGPALVLKHFAPLMATGLAFYAKLSARVGSISDNQKGGWYSYRASKAALNMLLQTAAIELQRRNPLLQVLALQPGTVQSKLSQPFIASVKDPLTPERSVSGMLLAMKALPSAQGAQFIDYQGQRIEW